MESIFSNILVFFLKNESIDLFAVMITISAINFFIWTKYIKPFLEEWKLLNKTILKSEKSLDEVNINIEEIKKSINELIESIEGYRKEEDEVHNIIKDVIEQKTDETHKRLLKEFDKLFPKLVELKNYIESKDDIEKEKLHEVLLELTKINLRLEYGQTDLRGLK